METWLPRSWDPGSHPLPFTLTSPNPKNTLSIIQKGIKRHFSEARMPLILAK